MLFEALRPPIARPFLRIVPHKFQHFGITTSHIALSVVEGRRVDGDFPALFGDVIVVRGEVELPEFIGQSVAIFLLEGGLHRANKHLCGFGCLVLCVVFALHNDL
jgi:hypothetical protein